MSKEQPVIKKEKSPLIKTLKWIGVAVISILLVLYFVFSSVSETGSNLLVGKVNNKPIYYSRGSAYAENLQRMSDSMNMSSFNDETRKLFSEILEYQAFTVTVNQMLMYEVAKKNVAVSDEYLVNNIKTYFIGDYGQFLEEEYRNFVQMKNAVEKKVIEQDIREQIALQTLGHELFQTIKTSSMLVDAELAKRNNRRSVEIIYASAAPIVRDYEPTEGELNMYFAESKADFAQADISWIITSSQSEANLIYDTLKNDVSSFAQMATDKSEDDSTSANAGKVGSLTQYEMPSSMIANAVFETQKNETILEPQFFDDYYYIILVHSINEPSSILDIDNDVIVAQYLRTYEDAILVKAKADLKEQLTADSASAADIRALSANGNYQYYTANNLYYGSSAFDAATGITLPFSTESIFSSTVFGTAVGSTSGVVELSDGLAIISVVSEDKAPTTAPANASQEEIMAFEQARYEAARDIYSQKSSTLARTWADNAFANAKVEYKLNK